MATPPPIWPQVYLYPPLAVLALWVGLTAGLLALNRRGPTAGRIALLCSLPLLLLAHSELQAVQHDLSILGGYRGFVAGTLIWAWHELAFYSGVLAGPWRAPCPPGARGLFRFGYALRTHLYHELAVLVELIVLIVLLHDARNLVGPLVFALSWAMQHSAKLNVLLGVRSLDVALFPPHLRYLGSFWARRPPSAFFLPAVSVATLLAVMLWFAAHAHRFDATGPRLALMAALVSLGALEHWMLALPARRALALPPLAEEAGVADRGRMG
jgi:putative photosynthetic complex assembly protein 2